jgi:hypothetical protein
LKLTNVRFGAAVDALPFTCTSCPTAAAVGDAVKDAVVTGTIVDVVLVLVVVDVMVTLVGPEGPLLWQPAKDVASTAITNSLRITP